MALVHKVHIQGGDNHSHITIFTYKYSVAAVKILASHNLQLLITYNNVAVLDRI